VSAVLPPGQLVVGMQLPVQSQSTIYAEAWEASAGAAEVRRVAQAADGAGFWYVAVCDHVAVPRPAGETMGTEWWDTVATLGWLAGITSRVRLVSHITVLAYRHPLVTAKAWSTLDVVSDGRAVMGVGTGHVAGELALLGVDFARRGALLDEAIDAVRACFAEEYPSFAGQEWRFADAGQRPRPVQPGGPSIWVGVHRRRPVAAPRSAATAGCPRGRSPPRMWPSSEPTGGRAAVTTGSTSVPWPDRCTWGTRRGTWALRSVAHPRSWPTC